MGLGRALRDIDLFHRSTSRRSKNKTWDVNPSEPRTFTVWYTSHP